MKPETTCGRSKGITFYRHHVEARVELRVVGEDALSVPLRFIDVIRRTHTTLDVLQESRTDDYWNIDGDRILSAPWTVFYAVHNINWKNHQTDTRGPGSG